MLNCIKYPIIYNESFITKGCDVMALKKKAVRNNIAENLNKYLVGLKDNVDSCRYYASVFATDVENAIEKAKNFVTECACGTAETLRNWTVVEAFLIEADLRVQNPRHI